MFARLIISIISLLVLSNVYASRESMRRYYQDRYQQLDEHLGEGFSASQVVSGLTIPQYKLFKVLYHCTIRIDENPIDDFFYQTELGMGIQLIRAQRRGPIAFNNLKGNFLFFGGLNRPASRKMLGLWEFNRKSERKKLAPHNPIMVDGPVCIKAGTQKKSLAEYQVCIENKIYSLGAQAAQNENRSQPLINYNPISNNCCHFAERILEQCGLKACFNFSKRASFGHAKGALELNL